MQREREASLVNNVPTKMPVHAKKEIVTRFNHLSARNGYSL